jgi:hypothetical protein
MNKLDYHLTHPEMIAVEPIGGVELPRHIGLILSVKTTG